MNNRFLTIAAVVALLAAAAGGAAYILMPSMTAQATPGPAVAAATPGDAKPAEAKPAEAPVPEPTAEQIAAALAIKPSDIGIGDPNAPVKMIEYASSGCPHCAHMALEVLPKIKAAYLDTGKVYYVLRDFPLDNVAVGASLIARCMPKDKFYAFVDILFAGQKDWHNPEIPDLKEALIAMAAKGGLSREEAEACLKNEANFAVMRDGQKEAVDVLKIDGTPTTFINGQRLSGVPPFEEFEKLFNAAPATP